MGTTSASGVVARARNEAILKHEAIAAVSAAVRRGAGLRVGRLAVVSSAAGRSIAVEIAASSGPRGSSVELSRLARQALKLRIGDTAILGPVSPQTVRRVLLTPFADLSTASGHQLEDHARRTLVDRAIPVSPGLIVHIRYPSSMSGTLYRVTEVDGGPGAMTDETEIKIEFTTESLRANLGQDLTFEDFGGLHEQLRLVRELVELPLRSPGAFRDMGILPPKGVLFFGPPGTGKTHLARALANEVAASFYQINGPEIVGAGYGETEGNIRRVFAEATHHAPSLVLIDEVDAIAPKRGQVGTQTDLRMVTQLMASMDGLRRSDGVIVVGTTNRIDALDPALRRPGRFDREILFAPPSASGRHEILQIHSREMPLTGAATDHLAQLAEQTAGYVGADLMELCREAGLCALRKAVPLPRSRQHVSVQADGVHVTPQDFDAALLNVRPSAGRQAATTTGGVRWSDLGGHSAVKARLKALVELPLKHPDRFAAVRLEPPSGILLYGPSGTGKSLIVRALATESQLKLLPVRGAEIFSQWLGESEEAIRQLFVLARQLAPTLVFIDQLEAIAPDRRRADEDGGTASRVVSQLLAELDGLDHRQQVIVVGATSRRDLVDPAILRPGRLGAHIFVGLPDEGDRRAILRVLLHDAPFASSAERAAIVSGSAKQTAGLSGADLRQLVDEAKLIALSGPGDPPVLRWAAFETALGMIGPKAGPRS